LRPDVDRRTDQLLKVLKIRAITRQAAGKRAACAETPHQKDETIKPVFDRQRWIPEMNECKPMNGAEDSGTDRSNFSEMSCGNVPQGDQRGANENEAALG
jgi:hypothetical protein